MKHQMLLDMGFHESPGPEDSTTDNDSRVEDSLEGSTTVDSMMGYAESLSEFSEGGQS
jgi:hypothetical protein